MALDLPTFIGHCSCHPTYILMAGGIATGKTHFAREHLDQFPILDIDDVMEEFGYTNYDKTGEEWLHAMEEISDRIIKMFSTNSSFIAMGTSSNLDATRERLIDARSRGYKTAICHITIPVKNRALEMNELRRSKNKRAVSIAELNIIHETLTNSTVTVATVEQEKLVDYLYVHVNNFVPTAMP